MLSTSTTLTIWVDAVPSLKHFAPILGSEGIPFQVADLKIVQNDVDWQPFSHR